MTGPSPSAAQGPPAAPTTLELCTLAELGPEARSLIDDPAQAPKTFIQRLGGIDLFTDAVRVIAFALPSRESVWWAWVCARKAAGPEPAPLIAAALTAAEQWVVQPTEEHRRAAMAAADRATLRTAAGCVGLAAFMTGGTIGPADVAPIPPPPGARARAVAGAVTIAAVTDPPKAPEAFREYIRLGLEVADRTKLWPAT